METIIVILVINIMYAPVYTAIFIYASMILSVFFNILLLVVEDSLKKRSFSNATTNMIITSVWLVSLILGSALAWLINGK